MQATSEFCVSDTVAIRDAVNCAPLNDIEAVLAQLPQIDLPLNHIFTPGLYVREIFIPKGTLCTSKIHRTEHPFVISKGRISVWTPEGTVMHYEAPFTGVTKPGTRRLLYAHEDVIWSTFHPTLETDLNKIEEAIIEPHFIPIGDKAQEMARLNQTAPCTT